MHGEIIDKDLTGLIISKAIEMHSKLGPGLLESAYEECLFYLLTKCRLDVRKQVPIPLVFEDVKLDIGYRLDLLVENRIIIELKSVEALNNVHTAQVLTYLKLSKCRIGLLINCNVELLKNGIKRYII